MRNITREQFGKLFQQLQPHVGYFSKLMTRVEKNGGAPGDPLFDAVYAAKHATGTLYIEVHYGSCPNTGGTDLSRPGDPGLWCGDGI